MAETHHILQQAINLGTPKHTPRRAELKKQLGQSAAVFSAFRVHRQAEHLSGLLIDEHGHRRPFHQWAKEAQPYLNHQNRAWLQTEYNQAISRAHNEADWQRFKQDADLFPNLEWMPSTSITPGADHQPFWGTILPIDHPFWGEHRPGDRWGCKCQLRSTDAAPTAAPSGSALTAMRPAPGLGSAPGSGQLFSSDHPYYPTNCTACPYANLTDKLRALASGKRKDCNTCPTVNKRIEKAADGYTKIPTERGEVRLHALHDPNEKAANEITATYLANRHGYRIDLLPKHPYKTSPDAYNHTLKRIQEFKNIGETTDNAVQMAIRKAKKQADSIVLVVPENIELKLLRDAIYNRTRRCPNVTDITVIMGNKDVTFTRTNIMERDFQISKTDFK